MIVKKRIAQAVTEESDNKLSKKAKKLAEGFDAPVQKNTLLNFVKPAAQMTAPKAAPKAASLDIDSLMEDMSSASKPSAARKPMKSLSKPVSRPTWNPARVLPTAGSYSKTKIELPTYSSDMDYENQAHNSYDDHHYEAYTSSNNMMLDDEYNAEPKSQPRNTKDRQLLSQEEIPMPAAEPVVEKISLTTTTKKFKLTEDVKPISFSDCAYDGSDALGSISNDLSGSTAISADSSNTAAAAIDPKLWLKKSAASESCPEAEEYFEMFWTDASENNGVIYLFGKVALTDPTAPVNTETQYVSCCVAVHGCERNLFILPRATGEFKPDGSPVRANMKDVYAEISKILVPNVIPRSQGQGFRCKQVKRNYAFEHGDIPREEMDYLKVVYSAKHGLPTPNQCEGGTHIERILGTGSTPLEWFLLKRQLLGPCWLTIKHPRTIPDQSISWCKLEVAIESPKFIAPINDRKIPNPPMITATLSMKTVVNPVTHIHEIVALAVLIHTKVSADSDTDGSNLRLMKRFVYIRPLGLSCGDQYPSVFPHDIQNEVKKANIVQTLPNERALLSLFSARLGQEDPDIIVSHNLLGFELEILFSRAVFNKVPLAWSKLGRLRRSKPPKSHLDKDLTAGRILCDTYKAAKEFLRETNYSLTSLSASQLAYERFEIDPIDVPKFFSTSQDIVRLAQHTANDTGLIQKLMLKLQVIPLTKQLTNLSGNLWSRTMRGARAERIEYLLMHEFHRYKYILPEKKWNNNGNVNDKKSAAAHVDDGFHDDEEDGGAGDKVGGRSRTRAKAAYAGGLVLEPKKGLYDTYILLLDFNSLYPSIIQEYNLCFTTIEWTKFMGEPQPAATASAAVGQAKGKGKSKKASSVVKTENTDEDALAMDDPVDDDDADDDLPGASNFNKELPPLPDSSSKMGHLPKVIKGLVDRRREVKSLLKKERDPNLRQQLDIRQKALKLTANSMYGCLGFTFSRFYARPIAALVTAKGREALQRTVDLATKKLGLDVIYGDTDSVMINTGSTDLAQVKEIGYMVKNEVNKLYKALELDLDGIFKSMLLLKKKKYAAVVIKEDGAQISYEKELKGLDLVRRDWCPLSQETGRYVVDQILSGSSREEIVAAIHEHLHQLSEDVRAGKIDIAKFVVTKGLNKNPKDYPDCKGQAHLQVALQMLKANKPVNIGDHIPYVICMQGPEGSTPPQRAYHPDEVIRSKGELTIDNEWYLSNQILPPISRLCEPIEGTSSAQLSQQLGLDASKYATTKSSGNDWMEEGWSFTPKCNMEDHERFKDCKKLTIVCSSCNAESIMSGILSNDGNASGLYCSACGSMYYGRRSISDCYCYLSNRVSLMVRKSLKDYYDCWLVCDDHTCRRRTMQQSVMGMRCTADCHGHIVQEYDAEALHDQLKYLESLFDFDRLKRRVMASSIADPNAAKRMQQAIDRVPEEHKRLFELLKQHMHMIAVKDSAYNWIRPSLFTAVFSRSLGLDKKTKA
jgi:DNA polymerase alpha subunit A